jgi:hypothetical protein
MSYNNSFNSFNNINNINDNNKLQNDENISTNNIPNHWLTLSLESCLIEAKEKLHYNENNNNTESVLNIIDSLLAVIKFSPQASVPLLKEIASLTKDLTNIHPNIAHILLGIYLSLYQPPSIYLFI